MIRSDALGFRKNEKIVFYHLLSFDMCVCVTLSTRNYGPYIIALHVYCSHKTQVAFRLLLAKGIEGVIFLLFVDVEKKC